jgi:hypothetical protein
MVGTINYDIYLAGGWCAYSGSGAPWGNSPTSTTTTNETPIAYFVAVKVAWGPDRANANPVSLGENDGTLVEYSSVQSQPGWTVTVSGNPNPESVLTLTTTTGITVPPNPIIPFAGAPNICPLALTGAA